MNYASDRCYADKNGSSTTQLKGRLKTARRGHKLLKDKRDELMRQFMDVVRLNKEPAAKVEEGYDGRVCVADRGQHDHVAGDAGAGPAVSAPERGAGHERSRTS